MVTRRDYTAEAVAAAKSVLIELTHLLGEYRDNIVLQNTVPFLLHKVNGVHINPDIQTGDGCFCEDFFGQIFHRATITAF